MSTPKKPKTKRMPKPASPTRKRPETVKEWNDRVRSNKGPKKPITPVKKTVPMPQKELPKPTPKKAPPKTRKKK